MPAQDWTRVVRTKRSKANSDANAVSIKHGTNGGYTAHYYYKVLPACESCKLARKAYMQEWPGSNPKDRASRWKSYKERNPNYKKDYHKAKPEQSRQDARRRRARKRNAVLEIYTEAQVLEVYGTDCHICLKPVDLEAPRLQGRQEGWEMGLQIDHLIPISVGGSDTIDNVRPAHAICNLKKGKYGLQ